MEIGYIVVCPLKLAIYNVVTFPQDSWLYGSISMDNWLYSCLSPRITGYIVFFSPDNY